MSVMRAQMPTHKRMAREPQTKAAKERDTFYKELARLTV